MNSIKNRWHILARQYQLTANGTPQADFLKPLFWLPQSGESMAIWDIRRLLSGALLM
jgi:hypothetical protein